MCNRSGGLIAREIERRGIPTVAISLVREYTETVRPPRAVFLRWPYGHPLGEPFNTRQQRAVLTWALNTLWTAGKPGTIVDPPYRWRREGYEELPAAVW